MQAEVTGEGQGYLVLRWKEKYKPDPWPRQFLIFVVLQLWFVFEAMSHAVMTGLELAV